MVQGTQRLLPGSWLGAGRAVGAALTPDDATFGDETVVFGRADSAAEAVRVVLNVGEVVEIDTVEVEGFEGRFYAELVEGDVDAERLAD